MFCTPSPTLETSSDPSFRRPFIRTCVPRSAAAETAWPPATVATATAPVTPRNERRFMLRFGPASLNFCISEPFVHRGRAFETDWLTAPSTDIPHISLDVFTALCQTRQYGFESRQSFLAPSAGILARSEWCANRKSGTLLAGGVRHAEAFSGSRPSSPQVEGARRLVCRGAAQGGATPGFVRADARPRLYRRAFCTLERGRGGQFRSAHGCETGHRNKDRALSSDGDRGSFYSEFRDRHPEIG